MWVLDLTTLGEPTCPSRKAIGAVAKPECGILSDLPAGYLYVSYGGPLDSKKNGRWVAWHQADRALLDTFFECTAQAEYREGALRQTAGLRAAQTSFQIMGRAAEFLLKKSSSAPRAWKRRVLWALGRRLRMASELDEPWARVELQSRTWKFFTQVFALQKNLSGNSKEFFPIELRSRIRFVPVFWWSGEEMGNC